MVGTMQQLLIKKFKKRKTQHRARLLKKRSPWDPDRILLRKKKPPLRAAHGRAVKFVTPRKPHSARRTTLLLGLRYAKVSKRRKERRKKPKFIDIRVFKAYVHGVGYRHAPGTKLIFIRGGGCRDLPSIRHSTVRTSKGSYWSRNYLKGLWHRKTRRSLYGRYKSFLKKGISRYYRHSLDIEHFEKQRPMNWPSSARKSKVSWRIGRR